MTIRRILLASLAATVFFLCSSAATVRADDFIAKFGGTGTANAGGHPVMTVIVTLITNGKTAPIPVPNEKSDKPITTAMPRKELDAAIKKLTIGQIVKITVVPSKELGTALDSIDPYDTKPGEDTPNGYVFSKSFDKTVGAKKTTSVVLTKFGVESNFTIAMRKGEKGEQEEDPDVVQAVSALKENDPVWVQKQGKSITAIEPYTAPKSGKVNKVFDDDVNGHKVHSAEIATDDGKTVTVRVPGKDNGKVFVPDQGVFAQMSKVKAGSVVEFRVHEDGDTMLLREITVQKPDPKKSAADKTMADKPVADKPVKPPAK